MEKKAIFLVEEASFLEAEDGLRLRYHLDFPLKWQAGDPMVILLTGRAECLDKYDRITEQLLSRRVAVLRKDWRGQGGSGRMLADPQKGYVTDFSLYIKDLGRILDLVAKPLNPGKIVFMGHSMGSHIALRYLLSGRQGIHAAILGSPMFSIETPPFPFKLVRAICNTAMALGLGDRYIPGGRPFYLKPFAANPLTGDPEYFSRFQNFLIHYPDFQMGAPTLTWMCAAALSMEQLWQDLGTRTLDTPILILSGERDAVVHPATQKKAATLLPGALYSVLKGGHHEIYMEEASIQEKLWDCLDVFGKKEEFFA